VSSSIRYPFFLSRTLRSFYSFFDPLGADGPSSKRSSLAFIRFCPTPTVYCWFTRAPPPSVVNFPSVSPLLPATFLKIFEDGCVSLATLLAPFRLSFGRVFFLLRVRVSPSLWGELHFLDRPKSSSFLSAEPPLLFSGLFLVG